MVDSAIGGSQGNAVAGAARSLQDFAAQAAERRQQNTPNEQVAQGVVPPANQASPVAGAQSSAAAQQVPSSQAASNTGDTVSVSQQAIARLQAETRPSAADPRSAQASAQDAPANPLQQRINDLLGDTAAAGTVSNSRPNTGYDQPVVAAATAAPQPGSSDASSIPGRSGAAEETSVTAQLRAQTARIEAANRPDLTGNPSAARQQ